MRTASLTFCPAANSSASQSRAPSAHSPAILLADEPIGNLDDESAQSVLALLDRLVRDAGGTMLIATHSAGVAAHCDRVIELHHGSLGAVPGTQP